MEIEKLNKEETQLLLDSALEIVTNSKQRLGQAFFNALKKVHGFNAHCIAATEADPFHTNRNLPKFFKSILSEEGIQVLYSNKALLKYL